jgi:hypothetical protein
VRVKKGQIPFANRASFKALQARQQATLATDKSVYAFSMSNFATSH